MFRHSLVLRAVTSRCRQNYAGFASSPIILAGQPNAPLNLDPSLQALLKDVDMSLIHHKIERPAPRELDVFPEGAAMNEAAEIDGFEDASSEDHLRRKSPAAHFGSKQIGSVTLPLELQKSINHLIAESDKHQLHTDAKRLFHDEDGQSKDWETLYDTKYRSRRQAARHSERDGTAFASIALPAHYSAVTAVLDHIKQRLEPEWKVDRVIDWGAGAGSGLWASLYSFQTFNGHAVDDLRVSNSTVEVYLGIEKREGLVTIGKRLLRDIELGQLSLAWQKSFKDSDKIRRSEGRTTLALSAFMLTSLPTTMARKTLVKEMWESGAHVMVLIDHNTMAGFENIAEARESLLNMGKKEFADPATDDWDIRGSHVVAPCPHDSACPLHHPGSNRLVCGFSQRLQRPAFVRRTKHSGVGHEDIGYSYVVIRRGPRPVAGNIKVGRVGEVGKREMDKKAMSQGPVQELMLHSDGDEAYSDHPAYSDAPAAAGSIHAADKDNEPQSLKDLEAALRLEAYKWPRLVFPPLKRSGHIILDSCTAEGKIMRLTIPRSQGKQPYYDARKSNWGDIFPHEPKNSPQERQPLLGGKGADIGKRRNPDKSKARPSYNAVSESLKEKRQKLKNDRNRRLEVLRD